MSDPVNHPSHYCQSKSGVECIQVTENMNFCVGNAMKYLWRAGLKGDVVEDLRKAVWYIEREIARRKRSAPPIDVSKLPLLVPPHVARDPERLRALAEAIALADSAEPAPENTYAEGEA